MYVIPRQQINEANQNEDILLEQPSFYILLGAEEDFVSIPKAYIGQTENFKERVKAHEAKKDFWNTALVFIAKDNSLTKADVQYIEAVTIKLAKEVNSYQLSENKVIPTPPNLPPHLRDIASEFIEDIKLLTTFINCPIFLKAIDDPSKDEIYYFKSRGGDAKAIYRDGVLTVLAGSIIAPSPSPSLRNKKKRAEMISNLTHEEKGKRVLSVNKEFKAPSMAGIFVCGNNTSGWQAWKNAKGEPLDKLRQK